MIKKHTFWIKVTIFFQFLTAAMHSLSFINKPIAENETEKQLFNLMTTYHPDFGGGFSPSFQELFTGISIGFTLLFILGALINLYLIRAKVPDAILDGIININLFVYGICFVGMLYFTFLPPIVCTGLIFLSIVLARLTFKRMS